ncbi:RNA polymerase sigma factor [Ruminococcus sp.]|uniref:RNA polymerase sigma factor n=1 Tax=Ruminococcus sp. TaxID=41978 RepID=UPI0038687B96
MTEITQELLDDLRAGKSEAYEQLYNQYYESVYTLTYGILQNYDDAQDAVQQTFIHVFRKLSTLKSDGNFSSWLMKIANNEALMLLRKRKNIPVPDEDIELQVPEQSIDEPTLPATMAERRDTAERLRRMIEKLPYEQRETLVLYYYHQQKITEIAAIMGCSESTTKSRLRYARASVKKEVEQWEKKNGERFRGVAAAPFGKVFVELLQKDAKQKRRRERTWKVILPALYTTSGSAGYAAGVFTTASSSLIVKLAAGAAACVIAVTGIAGVASGGGNGEEKGGSFYGGSGQAQSQQQEAENQNVANNTRTSNSVSQNDRNLGDETTESIGFSQFSGHYLAIMDLRSSFPGAGVDLGPGQWETEMDVNEDGSFSGRNMLLAVHDTDYFEENGYDIEIEYSKFSGTFSNIKKIDDYYTFQMDQINYENQPGTQEIKLPDDPDISDINEICLFTYSTAYGLDKGTKSFYLYTPDTLISSLPSDYSMQLNKSNVKFFHDTFPGYGFYSPESGYGWIKDNYEDYYFPNID